MSEQPEILYCVNHPNVETVVRCGKCGRPICVRCMHQTPVGMRCRECARLRRLPQYQVSGLFLVRAIGAAIGMAALSAVAWWLFFPMAGFFSLIIAAGIGYVVGEGVSRSVNRKGGPVLETIAAASVVLGFVIASLFGGHLNASMFRDIFRLLSVALAVYIAVMRMR